MRPNTIIATHSSSTASGVIAEMRQFPVHCLLAAIGNAALAAEIAITMTAIIRFQPHSEESVAPNSDPAAKGGKANRIAATNKAIKGLGKEEACWIVSFRIGSRRFSLW